MIDLSEIIENCKREHKPSQKKLFETYSPVLYGICVRYVSDKQEANDILQDGFIKIFRNINDYSGIGSFEGWMKRIMVNTAITHFHQNKKHNNHIEISEIEDYHADESQYESQKSDYTKEELSKIIKDLPSGYRVVFNLYAIEGYSHKEIAEMLEIAEPTSKSQYSRAKKLIRKKLEQISAIKKIQI